MRDIATEALESFLGVCRDHGVDIIGCDLNQAVALRKTHQSTPLSVAMGNFCRKHSLTSNYEVGELYGQKPGDCCGFVVMPSSSLWNSLLTFAVTKS